MDLKKKVSELYAIALRTPISGLETIAQAELYLQQAYEGRFLFELIQNVRDANKKLEEQGDIYIELRGDALTIANTGTEFDEQGIDAVSTIGRSDKRSQDLIGFKGIGFKSVQEISETPKIITRYGSVVFDRSLTAKDFPGSDEEDLPLFYCPHFDEEKLTAEELELGIVTKVALRLKPEITEKDIVKAFEKIKVRELVVLGHMRIVKFDTVSAHSLIRIDHTPGSPLLSVTKDGEPDFFKTFMPRERVQLSPGAITALGKKEQRLFLHNPSVEVKVVMALNEKKQTLLLDQAKLYLFYPLDIVSGFRFIIHSYFMVDPERKALRGTKVNAEILAAIGAYLSNELLPVLMAGKANVTRILTFTRQEDEKLQVLYDAVVDGLKDKKFIFDTKSRKYYSLDQVMIADDIDEHLFPEGKLGGRQLVYMEDNKTVNWLLKEFDADYLDFGKIAEEIEAECRKQAKEKNLAFFQHLYNYVAKYEDLDLTGRKVLLTDQWKLVTSQEDVLYGGSKRGVRLFGEVKKHIHFIHKEIKIEDFRDGRSRTGIVEYSAFQLCKRLLKLMQPGGALNQEVLNSLFVLELDNKSSLAIQENILLPVEGSGKWLSPVYQPIYIGSPDLRRYYPKAFFVDESVFDPGGAGPFRLYTFLKLCGAWDIPAVFVSAKGIATSGKDEREKPLIRLGNISTTPFTIINDRLLDLPEKIDHWFTSAVFDHWDRYQEFIAADHLERIQFFNNSSNKKTVPKEMLLEFSGFLRTLRHTSWIAFKGEDGAYLPRAVTGMQSDDFYKPHNMVLRRFLRVFPVDFGHKKTMLAFLRMRHLDGDTLDHYTGVLTAVYEQYKDRPVRDKEFIDFYNKLLNKLFEFYAYRKSEKVDLDLLEQQWFLAQNELDRELVWKRGKGIFFIDDKPNYDILPISVKQIVQPQFTLNNKQTFGKIAAKIGTRFSESISRKLLDTERSMTMPLTDYFAELPEAIALLEFLTDKALNKELERIKNSVVKERLEIWVSVTVAGSEAIEIGTDFYVDHNVNFELHIRSGLMHKNKVLAEAIHVLFSEIGREARRYNLELFRFLNSRDRAGFLAECEISPERILEIRERLSTSTLNAEQRFWDALLAACSVTERSAVFGHEEVDVTGVAGLLNVPDTELTAFAAEFEFRNSSAAGNLPALQALLRLTGIALTDLNKYLFPKIDLRDHFDTELIRLKNRFEQSFRARLHRYLLGKKAADQQNYLALLDGYNAGFRINVPPDLLLEDIFAYFLARLTEAYPELSFSLKDIRSVRGRYDQNAVYLQQRKAFKAALKDAGIKYAPEQLDRFVNQLKWGSLFYFDQTVYLVRAFRAWTAGQQPRPEPKTETAADLMAELDIGADEDIEDVETASVPHTPSGTGAGGGGGSGAHYDGGANDAYKQKIGLAAEMVVYQLLAARHTELKWVSKNASKAPEKHPGYNPQGDDQYGYDIEYLDSEGNKHFVEVKGRGEYNDAFEITKFEVQKAYETKDRYHVILVTHTLHKPSRRIRHLGNLFLLESGQDFFANERFTAIYKSFEIRFHERA
jgi:hypothetical protein